MSNKSGTSEDVISSPSSGGAVEGIGETFSPDLFTGTGNSSVPISVPEGRNGFQPDLTLVYSTGQGNSPFGLGWSLDVPGVRRKTSDGVPHYIDVAAKNSPGPDTFVLFGAEDLVRIGEVNGVLSYRPRTEGLFARIEHHTGGDDDYWKVWSKDGKISLYGTPFEDWPQEPGRDPATLSDPEDLDKIVGWRLTETRDPFGNVIRYSYFHDQKTTDNGDPHRAWEQIYLEKIEYADYGDPEDPNFLLSVEFDYEERPDPFSSFRSGFEIRTRKRCTGVKVFSSEVSDTDPIREYELVYAPDDELFNGVSVLKQVQVTGYDDQQNSESLPPLEFTYSDFDPEDENFQAVGGKHAPGVPLSHPEIETVDVTGNGLPDIVEMSGHVIRYWENEGDGTFSFPRVMDESPMGLSLAEEGVQFIDADGDARPDLMVTRLDQGLSGYFPMRFEGGWDAHSFQPYEVVPPFSFDAPDVTTIDLTGDGVSDVLRTSRTFECYFNDKDSREAWKRTRNIERRSLETFPDVNLADPRVHTADMTGDGLQDIVLIHSGRVDYWPNMGHGNFGPRITMENAPTLPKNYHPQLLLLGDIDGSGCADLIYVDNNGVNVAMNKTGNGFADSFRIKGTPVVADVDALRLIDLYGTGSPGLLWTKYAPRTPHRAMYFLDFTGGKKPYLLTEMNNHMGSVTRVGYEPSTKHYMRDRWKKKRRWKTPLPFPVQTVTKVEVIDQISKGKLTTEYEYQHGYWDGFEREFRGFGHVVQRDTETFEDYNEEGLFPGQDFHDFEGEDAKYFQTPVETHHWFDLGPVHHPRRGWSRYDFSRDYWKPEEEEREPHLLKDWDQVRSDIAGHSLRERRDALRTLRGTTLRTEVYGLDGSEREDRPFVVTETVQGVKKIDEGESGEEELSIFFPFQVASRTTNWDRGDDPATTFEFVADYDEFGQPERSWTIACPRGWQGLDHEIDPDPEDPQEEPDDPFLSVHEHTEFIHVKKEDQYMVDRVATSKSHEVVQEGARTLVELVGELEEETNKKVSWSLQGLSRHYYDGDAYVGEEHGKIGDYGALTRSKQLILTDDILAEAYPDGTEEPDSGIPVYLDHDDPGDPNDLKWSSDYPDEFQGRIDALEGRAGYVYDGGEGHFFVTTARKKRDYHDDPNGEGRGLLLGTKDPLGEETVITYDTFDLLPLEVTDPLGMKTKATHNYRVFQPAQVTDPNGNRSQFAFSPLGLVEAKAIMGREGENEGDTLEDPGVEFEYDFTAFDDSGDPVSVTTTTRVYHVNDSEVPSGADPNETITQVEYSDGFGRVIQSRIQAEELDYGDAGLTMESVGDAQADSSSERVRVTGWERYNNKGEIVEKWEPFFSTGFDFEDVSESPEGQSIQKFYDARERQVLTIQPNGAEGRVVYGIPHHYIDDSNPNDPEDFDPTPWEVYTYDANDNGDRAELEDIDPDDFSDHWDTPGSVVVDALGREVKMVQRDETTEYTTKIKYDIRGNVLSVTDPLDREATKKVYDLADNPLRAESIDAGTSVIVYDATATPVESRDARGSWELTVKDELLRPTHMWGRDNESEDLRLVQHIVYGDDPSITDPEDENLLGKPHIHRDEAGRLEFESYDFKGGLLEKNREVIDPQLVIDAYQNSTNGVDTFRVDWTPEGTDTFWDREEQLLQKMKNEEDELVRVPYQVSTTYDALGRAKEVTYPEDVDKDRKVLKPTYNKAGALQSVELDGITYVDHIAYNPRGQRILAAHGNGVMTRYVYDEKTFQLQRLRSEEYDKVGDDFELPTEGKKHQDIEYTYDAVGNVLTIEHSGDDVGINGTSPAPDVWGTYSSDKLIRLFEYDPLYRLKVATGRECDQTPQKPWQNLPGCQDITSARAYREEYKYDEVGSLEELNHRYIDENENEQNWKRTYDVQSGSNRVDKMTAGQNEYNYSYDEAGNLIQENTERFYKWDHAGSMKEFRVDDGNTISKYGHYSYDAGGQRVLKVNIQGSAPVSTVYIDGIFEHHRIHHDTQDDEENNTLHVMDDTSRIATKRVGPDIFDTTKPAILYHLGDHLGSSNVVLDDQGTFINREEYRPYGETSFGSYEKKRYRFSGKERDEESGLYYHGARYYAPWLARWTAPDPAGMVDGVNLYEYVRGNPVRLVDPDGRESSLGDEPAIDDIPPDDRTAFELRGGESAENLPEYVTIPTHLVVELGEIIDDNQIPSDSVPQEVINEVDAIGEDGDHLVFHNPMIFGQPAEPLQIERAGLLTPARAHVVGKLDHARMVGRGNEELVRLATGILRARDTAPGAERIKEHLSIEGPLLRYHTHPGQPYFSRSDLRNAIRTNSPSMVLHREQGGNYFGESSQLLTIQIAVPTDEASLEDFRRLEATGGQPERFMSLAREGGIAIYKWQGTELDLLWASIQATIRDEPISTHIRLERIDLDP